jgi:NTE family protein
MYATQTQMKTKIGIGLSGGGTRGIAHIGVLQALEENGIFPDYISGASAGALVGSLYAAEYSPAEILDIFKDSSLAKLFKLTVPTGGLIDNSYIDDMLKEYIPDDSFEGLKRRLFISITNLSKGYSEIIGSGPLHEVVVTSTSIPILFNYRKINGDIYADGGILNNLPIEPLDRECDLVIGVNVSPISKMDEFSGIMDVAYRTLDLAMWSNVQPRLKYCDVVIEPNAENYGYFALKKADEIYQEGYEAAMEKMPQILAMLDPSQLKGRRRRKDPTGLEKGKTKQKKGWKVFWQRIIAFFRRILGIKPGGERE